VQLSKLFYGEDSRGAMERRRHNEVNGAIVKLPRVITATVGTVALVAALTGCASAGSASAGKQTVTFWQFDTSKPTIAAYDAAIAAFEKKNPDITVQMQIVPWASQQQKITTAIASGSLPDVSMLGNDVVAQYAAAGNLAPLDSYVSQWSKSEGRDIKADMFPGDRSYYTYKGKLYGSPVADETRLVYYNKALFQQAGLDPNSPPTTWDQMQQAAEKLKTTGATPWALPMSNQYITMQTFMSVYLSYGARLFDSSGKCGLDSTAGRAAMTYYTGIAKAGLTTDDAANQASADFDNLFAAGKAGMEIEGPGLYTQIKTQNPSLLKDIGIAPIPAGPKGTYGFLGGWPLVMWKTAKDPDAAAKWIEYATSPKGALNAIAKESGILPGRISLSKSGEWTAAPYDQFAKQLATNAYAYQYPSGPSPKMGQIETATVQTAVQQVATGSLSVPAAMQQMCTSMNGILAK
jgi:ABC-type glycerol-3-phosphate transport system substrate-binding protein